MKKLLLIATAAACLSSLSAFAQGSFSLNTSARWTWDNFTSGTPAADNKIDIGFLMNFSGSGTATISGLQAFVPTNSAVLGQSWSNSTAWSDILNDPNFQFATNNSTLNLIVATSSSLGGVALPGSTFVENTSSAGGTIKLIMVGWNSLYADPFTAASNGSAVGWSSVFTYSYVGTAGTPTAINAQDPTGTTKFGVFAPVPEPTVFALSGLSAAALLIFRRRRS